MATVKRGPFERCTLADLDGQVDGDDLCRRQLYGRVVVASIALLREHSGRLRPRSFRL